MDDSNYCLIFAPRCITIKLQSMATTTIKFDEPNEVTKAAIKEAKSGKNPNKVYDDVDELFKDLDSDK